MCQTLEQAWRFIAISCGEDDAIFGRRQEMTDLNDLLARFCDALQRANAPSWFKVLGFKTVRDLAPLKLRPYGAIQICLLLLLLLSRTTARSAGGTMGTGGGGTLHPTRSGLVPPVPPSQRCGLCQNFKQTTLTTRLYKVRTICTPPLTKTSRRAWQCPGARRLDSVQQLLRCRSSVTVVNCLGISWSDWLNGYFANFMHTARHRRKQVFLSTGLVVVNSRRNCRRRRLLITSKPARFVVSLGHTIRSRYNITDTTCGIG